MRTIVHIIWPFNFRLQWTLWFTCSLWSLWEVFLENLWSSEEIEQDFKALPNIASLKRQSEGKNSGDNVSDKQQIMLVTSVNQGSKDSQALAPSMSHYNWVQSWFTPRPPDSQARAHLFLTYLTQICFIQFFVECMFTEPVLRMCPF